MLAWIVFLGLAAVLLSGAFMAVRSSDLVHTVLWLALVLIGTAVVYVVLHADFIAAVQILLYTGGVITLMLFSIMLTRHSGGPRITHGSRDPLRALGVLVAIITLVGFAIVRSVPLSQAAPEMAVDTQALGAMVLTDMVLPFEVLSVLLLAAMIGAIVLARREDDGRPIATLKRRSPPIRQLPDDGEPPPIGGAQ